MQNFGDVQSAINELQAHALKVGMKIHAKKQNF